MSGRRQFCEYQSQAFFISGHDLILEAPSI